MRIDFLYFFMIEKLLFVIGRMDKEYLLIRQSVSRDFTSVISYADLDSCILHILISITGIQFGYMAYTTFFDNPDKPLTFSQLAIDSDNL